MAIHQTKQALQSLLAVCLLAACGQGTPADFPEASRKLAEAIGPRRLVEPRLTAFDAYAPCSPADSEGHAIARAQCPGSPAVGSPAYDAAFDFELEFGRRLATRGEPSHRHLQGLLSLVWIDTPGAVDEAIRAFEQLAADAPGDAELWSDLAASYLVRAQQNDDPLDLLHGLDLVERSLGIDPDLPEARFNRALALEKLYLQDLARGVWESYLEIDSESGWAGEAREYLDRPAPAPVGDQWESDRPVLVAAVEAEDRERVVELIDRYRKTARLWAEDDLLAAWAKAQEDGDSREAERLLAVAREIGTALADLGGEHLLFDAVAAIDSAAEEPAKLRRLVRGHLAYDRALELMGQREFAVARSAFVRAVELLRPISAFRWRARFFDQLCAGRAGAREEAVRLGEEIAAAVAANGRYPVTQARALWVAGTSLVVLGRFGAAEEAYLRALELFERAGEVDSFVAVSNFVAGIHDQLGDSRQAWRRNMETLRQLRDRPLPRRQRDFLTVAAFSAAELGELRAAHLFADAELAMAREQLDAGLVKPDSVATHLWHRAHFRRLLGRTEEALEDAAEARVLCDRVESEDDRRTLLPEILFEEARSLAASRPAEALAELDEAEAMFQASESAYMLPTLLREKARSYTALDDLEGAAASLDGAIEILDRQREELRQAWHQMSFFDRVGTVYDEKLGLQLRRGAAPEELLRTAEDGRSRVLLDWLFDLGSASDEVLRAAAHRPPPVAELLKRLPAESVIVEYEVLDHRLLIWVVRGGDLRLEVRDVEAGRLAAKVHTFREGLQVGGVESDSAGLWDLLFEPIRSEIAGVESLVIAADGELHNLPFAALRDVETGRFLIEDHRLSFVPSLSALVELGERGRPEVDLRSARFLVVADPAFDPDAFDLHRLDGARLEAMAIAERFGDVEVLAGAVATPSAVLGKIGSFDVFHYAGHALANWRSPLRSSLVLAPESGEPGSGALFARDFLDLDLDRPQLVVLSACETAYGGRPSREGVVGLVWPLLARGVPEVVASLWSVNDVATVPLFVEFYDALAAGVEPVEALRTAQLARAKAEESFDWAAFQHFGLGS